MNFKAITITDIAKALNISASTVSKALSDSYEISAKTKQIVLTYAREPCD
ncbi:MAG: LacI family transcriptional regulator [Mucilaginibacter sp.]|jgi:LacI family transcriptional regulator|nr:LacI family transcriptional regulator [Mucilaginibacter sp.]